MNPRGYNRTSLAGLGFTAVEQTAQTTVHLEPGEYVAECYVKDENEEFHSYLGMLKHFTVTDTPDAAEQPVADLTFTIYSADGIWTDQELKPGKQIVGVFFEDQTSYATCLAITCSL